MSKRKTTCLTYGETATQGVRLRNAEGAVVGHLCSHVWIAVCGREVVEEGDLIWGFPEALGNPRPPGICPRCWAKARKDRSPGPDARLEALGLPPCPA